MNESSNFDLYITALKGGAIIVASMSDGNSINKTRTFKYPENPFKHYL